MNGVEVVFWNPRRGGRGAFLSMRPSLRRRVNNLGDLLGPMIVRQICARLGIDIHRSDRPRRRLLTVGSILRIARTGDVIWGSGVNGKSADFDFGAVDLDVRALRGPLTSEVLRRCGHSVPQVFGDPGLLVGRLWPVAELRTPELSRDVCVIPNFHDVSGSFGDPRIVDPRSPVSQVVRTIASSRLVVGSSLHAVIVAESLGVPARLVRTSAEPEFKYRDYYYATGRPDFVAAGSVTAAVDMGGERPPRWDAEPLLAAFPIDLWTERTKQHDEVLRALVARPTACGETA